MAKLDGLKELLNNLRILLSIFFLMLIALTSGLVNRFDKIGVDDVFYIGSFLEVLIMIVILYILKRISQVTREVKYTKE